jgi:hypothetical protein
MHIASNTSKRKQLPCTRHSKLVARTKAVVTVRDDTHDGISPHALLEKKAIEETISPSRFGRYKHETRPKLSIALDSPCSFLELPCDQVQ